MKLSRFLDLPRNLENVKEKPNRKTCFSVKRIAWLQAFTRQNFASRRLSELNEISVLFHKK